MPNMETPTGATGQDVPAIHNPALDDLPPKMRVHALGKALGVGSKVILAALAELGETARSPQSSVSRDVAVRVAQVL
ncbi:MAG: translation initiation factor IF-2 N-terminal domain-containing protein, partial [Kutzneria sp.]|nr:translation initiation factor IF-2 N-terminal domain-containing protein [Kutzneria sp.]